MENISRHITYKEATGSPTARRLKIDNTPNAQELEAMKLLAESVFEPVREHFNKPILVTSFFRSKALNKAVGGSATSQHMLGEAMDIKATKGFTNKDIFEFIKNNLDFDQVIWEFGSANEPAWVHVSYRKNKNRKQALRATKVGGVTKYIRL